eukprot:TRINITY_DN1711_c0_g1_i1.p1 TRINITY_DN1711_c0_g1~~TRINITY_DN1711_c0_g1_i1.p1  ORF type:complete len:776 (+),score=214.40 TRINITY_DN1711_c0_g1_i1:124-2451(+)
MVSRTSAEQKLSNMDTMKKKEPSVVRSAGAFVQLNYHKRKRGMEADANAPPKRVFDPRIQNNPIVVTQLPRVLSSVQVKLSKEYFQKYSNLLKLEIEDELLQVERRIKKWSKRRLMAEGLALFDMKGKMLAHAFGEFSVRFTCDKEIPKHKFSEGDMVMLTSPSNPGLVVDGYVEERTRRFITVATTFLPPNLDAALWRIDKSANRIAFDRIMEAMNALNSAAGIISGGTSIKDIIIGNVKDIAAAASLPPSKLLSQFYSQSNFPRDFQNWKLNESQMNVIQSVLQRKLTLIQGPPGTGKTSTAIHLIRLLCHLFQGKVQILCTGDTNVAVDNLLQGLYDCGIRVLRVGRATKIREELRERSLEALIEKHPMYPELQRLQSQYDMAVKNQLAGTNKRDLNSADNELKDLETKIADDIINTVQVVCSTCIGSGHHLIAGRSFKLVIVDESTQATEPRSLVPIVRNSEQVILFGDHFQLPPTVVSQRASEAGLSLSLFQRLADAGVKPLMLQTQYRMHPTLSEFSSNNFYDGKVNDGISKSDRATPKGFEWPDRENPVCFVPVDSKEAKSVTATSKSKMNVTEAYLVRSIVDDLLATGELTADNIGVISPYSGQIRKLTEIFSQNGDLQSGRYHKLNINSVDGYQGREKEVIIFSTVRANAGGRVGFLKDWRRLNVAITRARRGLIVVGHQKTLENDPHWNKWLAWISANGFAMDGPPLEALVARSGVPESELPKNQRKKSTESAQKEKTEVVEKPAETEEFFTDVEDVDSDSEDDV